MSMFKNVVWLPSIKGWCKWSLYEFMALSYPQNVWTISGYPLVN